MLGLGISLFTSSFIYSLQNLNSFLSDSRVQILPVLKGPAKLTKMQTGSGTQPKFV